jgi:hypothetical protein
LALPWLALSLNRRKPNPCRTGQRKADAGQGHRKSYLFVMDNPFVTGTLLDIEGGALINSS